MKIAITGHTAGIGQAFARYLSARGHEIVGISKREGNNIRNIPKVVQLIEPCDMWINNAQSGYSQTELLYKIWYRWTGQEKMIWLISTTMTQRNGIPPVPGLEEVAIAEYKNQKCALENAFVELRSQKNRPYMTMIRPGAVATQEYNVPNENSADVDKWVESVCEFYSISQSHNLWLEEISLGFRNGLPRL